MKTYAPLQHHKKEGEYKDSSRSSSTVMLARVHADAALGALQIYLTKSIEQVVLAGVGAVSASSRREIS
jgi:hypothetical protein